MQLFDLNSDRETHEITPARMMIFEFSLVSVLLVSSILVCGTNAQCRAQVPTLGGLLESSLVAPFMYGESFA